MTDLLIREKLPENPHFSELDMIYLVFLLRKIGFTDERRLIEYLKAVINVYGKYEKTWVPRYLGGGTKVNFESSRCFGLLRVELAIRENLQRISFLNSNTSALISATDLANFCFCPVSYIISKSFDVKFPTNLRARSIGSDLHEDLRLTSRLPKEFLKRSQTTPLPQADKIQKIRGCKLIFAGHSGERRVFRNEPEKFIGQPDYIFQDPKGKYFVVEEKFHADEAGEYNNHLVQLQAYIKYIREYDISYGVLINWSYDFHYKTYEPFINNVKVKVVKRDQGFKLLNTVQSQLRDLQEKKELKLSGKQNINKCVSCVVNKYCFHKTGRTTQITFPYQKEYLQLEKIEKPEILHGYIENESEIDIDELYNYIPENAVVIKNKNTRRRKI